MESIPIDELKPVEIVPDRTNANLITSDLPPNLDNSCEENTKKRKVDDSNYYWESTIKPMLENNIFGTLFQDRIKTLFRDEFIENPFGHTFYKLKEHFPKALYWKTSIQRMQKSPNDGYSCHCNQYWEVCLPRML